MRLSVVPCGCLVVVGLCASASPAFAQQAGPHREGFWFGGGVAWGSVGASGGPAETSDQMRSGGVAGMLQAGGTLGPHMRAGVEGVWFYSSSGINQPLGALSAVVQWYPATEYGLFVEGGLGWYHFSRSGFPYYYPYPPYTPLAGGTVSSNGLSVVVGIGLDLYVGRAFSLTPFVRSLSGLTESHSGPQYASTNMTPSLVQVGVSAVWH